MSKDHNNIAHPKRRNKLSEQWASYPIAMLDSPAYRVLSQGAHRVIARIAIELASHGGNDNGQLPITKEQFVEYGLHNDAVAPAIREAEALGFIRITEHGRGGNADQRRPNLFYITFLNERGSRAKPPSHDWQKIETIEDAERIAAKARSAKSERAVNNGRAAWKTSQAKKQKPVPETRTEAGHGNQDRTARFPGHGNQDYRVSPETRTTSISREGRPSPSLVSEHQGGTIDVRTVVRLDDRRAKTKHDAAIDHHHGDNAEAVA